MKNTRNALLLFWAVFFFAVIFNTGFIASDEYWDGIARYTPAQNAHLNNLIKDDDVKSPTQIIPMFWVSQAAYKMGVEEPFTQYHIVIIFFGLLCAALLALSVFLLYGLEGLNNKTELNLALLVLTFHFMNVSYITRPMFESLSAPWLTLGAVLAVVYDQTRATKYLLWGVVCGSIAFMLRQQTGIACLIFVILPLVKKDWKSVVGVAVLGVACLILSGLPDFYLRGSWHYSLRALADYNIKHGAEYGKRPWHYYFPLLIIITLAPWWIKRYPTQVWSEFKKMRAIWMIVILFIGLHMMFDNKFERFLIPIIPILLFLVVPFFADVLQNYSKHKVRVWSLLVLNMIVWPMATFLPAQKNIIDMALYLNDHPEVKHIYNLDESIDWLPAAFVKVKNYDIREIKQADFASVQPELRAEGSYLAVSETIYQKNLEAFKNYEMVQKFDPNVIDLLAYKLNAKNNARRAPLVLLKLKSQI